MCHFPIADLWVDPPVTPVVPRYASSYGPLWCQGSGVLPTDNPTYRPEREGQSGGDSPNTPPKMVISAPAYICGCYTSKLGFWQKTGGDAEQGLSPEGCAMAIPSQCTPHLPEACLAMRFRELRQWRG